MTNTKMDGVQRMQDFVNEQWATGLHREIIVRYTNEGMFVVLDFSNKTDKSRSVVHIFTWDDI